MNRLAIWFLALFLCAGVLKSGVAADTESGLPVTTLGVVREGTSKRQNRLREKTKKTLDYLTADTAKVVFNTPPVLNCQWESSSFKRALQAALADENLDIILLEGAGLAAYAASSKIEFDKPIITALIHDPEIIGLPYDKKGFSTRKNFLFFGVPGQFKADLKSFKQLIHFKKLCVVFDAQLLEIVPEINKNIKKVAEELNFEVKIIPAGSKAQFVLKQFDKNTEAVYLTPVSKMSSQEEQLLIEGINQKNIPSFSLKGESDVEKGVFGGLLPDMSDLLPRWIALAVFRVAEATPSGSIPVGMKVNTSLAINKKTAKMIGFKTNLEQEGATTLLAIESEFSPKSSGRKGKKILRKKVTIKEGIKEFRVGATLSYEEAIKLAKKNNMELMVNEQQVEIIRQERDRELTKFFPQITANSKYSRIDKNQAEVTESPEWVSKMGATLSQLIFSDPVFSAYQSASKTLKSQKLKREALQLGISKLAESLFIECLAAKALLEIEINNLRHSRSNLKIAQSREEIGVSQRSDVYRWESQVAQQEIAVLEKDKVFKNSLINLNKAMGASQDKEWKIEDIDRKHFDSGFAADSFGKFIKNQGAVKVLKKYAFKTAIANSPEMKAFTEAIEAEKIMLGQAERSFFTPEVSTFFDYEHRLGQQYVDSALDSADNNKHWMLGVKASLPIFSGGKKIVDIKHFNAKVQKIKNLHRQAVQGIEERVYNAVAQLETSWPQIKFAQTALEMASKDFNIIKDKYSEGEASIIQLLDAQNNILAQRQSAALAKYRYQQAVANFLRATSWRSFVDSRQDHDAWFKKLRELIKKER